MFSALLKVNTTYLAALMSGGPFNKRKGAHYERPQAFFDVGAYVAKNAINSTIIIVIARAMTKS
jgi:hypothetical protein